MASQRLDKWLWCARIIKTRTSAVRLIVAGKIRINRARALKPSRLVQSGDVVTAAMSGRVFIARVLAVAERRGPASLARTLYEDLTPQVSPEPEGGFDLGRQKGARPTKKDRRRIDALRGDA
jgi:ribosome-associated heat shock protein Hsp15